MLAKPWKYIPTKWGHQLAPWIVPIIAKWQKRPQDWLPFSWRGLYFANRLGPAGGFDKLGSLASSGYNLGFGFVEVGTVTPLPQQPNPGVIMARDWSQKTLWNKMGFPSPGSQNVFEQLSSYHYKLPLFINIGKNRQTPNDQALEDYSSLIQSFQGLADVFVVNISSPNTLGLRALQGQAYLTQLVAELRKLTKTPIVFKLSPDLSDEELVTSIDTIAQERGDGVILTNTTTQRPPNSKWPIEGGLSGQFLNELATQKLKVASHHIKQKSYDLLLVSAGGIMTPQDVQLRLSLGADLVQVYSVLVFEGFSFIKDVSDFINKRK